VTPSSALQIPLELAYERHVLFAIELLDPVTLSRVTREWSVVSKGLQRPTTLPRVKRGLTVVAEGLQGKPFVSFGGVFVWLQEDFDRLQKITIDPGDLPYDAVEIAPDQLHRPLMTIELPPRVDYPFPSGVTGLRGTLVEERLLPPNPLTPVAGAEARLSWLDEDDVTWRDAPTVSRTNQSGDFVVLARLAAADAPKLDAAGALTVRLRFTRNGMSRRSADLKLPQGRIAEPATFSSDAATLVFAWDELQP
jgi:hypothetical protein